jgi:hypothetical protein
MKSLANRSVSAAVVAALLCLSLTGGARAELIGTGSVAESVQTLATPRESVSREALAGYLEAAGLPRDEAARRAATVPDSELATLADPASQPAGGAIVGVVIFVLALLVLTDALGYTDIFPFKLKR